MLFRNCVDGSTLSREEIRERFGGTPVLDEAISEVFSQCATLAKETNKETNIEMMQSLNRGVLHHHKEPLFGKNTSVRDILLLMGVFADFSNQPSDKPYSFEKNEQSVLSYLKEGIIEYFTSQYTKLAQTKRFSKEVNSGLGLMHFDPIIYISNPVSKCKCEKTLNLNGLHGFGSYQDVTSNWIGDFSLCNLLKGITNNILSAFRVAEEHGATYFKWSKNGFFSLPICVGYHWSLLEVFIRHDYSTQEFCVKVIHQNARRSFEQEAYYIVAHILMSFKLISLHQDFLDSFLNYKGKFCHVEMKKGNFCYEFQKVNRSNSMKQPGYDVTSCGVYTLANLLLDTPTRSTVSMEKRLELEQSLGLDGIRKILLTDCLKFDMLTRPSLLGKKPKSQCRNVKIAEKKAQKRKLT